MCGPEITAWSFALPVGSEAVGVRFRPGMAGVVFDGNVSSFANRRIRLGELVGAERERRLAEHLEECPTELDRMHAVSLSFRVRRGHVDAFASVPAVPCPIGVRAATFYGDRNARFVGVRCWLRRSRPPDP